MDILGQVYNFELWMIFWLQIFFLLFLFPYEIVCFSGLLHSQICITQHRNQRMAEDQSVVGRRRIYYDQHGSEALICSDSEEEFPEPEEEKREFTPTEDRIIS